jgi:hypothetical protein
MKPYTTTQKTRIVNNIMAAIAMNIDKLNGPAYRFISGCPGFIAHYNLSGFKAHYETESLARAILANQPINQWVNFKPGHDWYEYNMARKDIYNTICNNLRD